MINFRSSDSCRRIDRIARAFYRSGTTGAVTLDVSKAFDRVWHAGLLHKVKRYGITGQISGLFSSFLSNRRSSSKELHFILGLFLVFVVLCSWSTLFLLYTNDLSDFICNIAIYADDTTLDSKCDRASDLVTTAGIGF